MGDSLSYARFQDAWEFVEKGYTIPEDVANLSQNGKETSEDEKKKDQQALNFIYRTLDETMFEMVSNVSSSKKLGRFWKLSLKILAFLIEFLV
ncbi:hypothetical protein CR513_28840, partial [Mucuna pruriens]